ncbi:hypothetical protein NLI96_g5215 [Meripilus lineatus]|uniref:N-acetyltransferase domain-containing protein n=1 Tax=Meripilus lineatus TaxID=2056292 RepID=A0AAD5V3E8_9APHY|nr:hypothetical protein NLI96_g5215 [Physisporinus lineatus]
MSAYGAIRTSNRPTEPLATTIWYRPARKADLAQPSPSINYVTIHHLTLKAALEYSDLVPYLHASFAEELERGMTYPQEILQGETYTQLAFEGYFFAADVLVAIIGHDNAFAEGKQDGNEVRTTLDEARNGRSWEECIAGFYYVKPNYPGRSSHICNAGFLIPSAQRSRGFGAVLARSYLHYGPRLGYEASVFNLVYVNNVASVRLWEALNFTKAGLIPRAGRLRKADGSGEEYVDAWVFYKRFGDDSVEKEKQKTS